MPKEMSTISPVAPTICYHEGGKLFKFLNMQLLAVVHLLKQDYKGAMADVVDVNHDHLYISSVCSNESINIDNLDMDIHV